MIIQTIILVLMLICCFITDLTKQKIYNWATLPGIGVGFLINGILTGIPGLKSAGLGFAIGFGFLLIIFLVGGMGGGDVKLMGAIGALRGYPFIISALVYSILVGGFIAFAVLIWKKRFLKAMWNIFFFLFSKLLPFIHSSGLNKDEMEKVPFGIAIVIGTIWALIMEGLGRNQLVLDVFTF